ncbi:hypothetical protein I5M27_04105 [Adhaeribacter sp. BT258]|uniref:Lipoprotein n=1 Tax=Adhaeribacter terrigena TaxID=2793070 RepID=A0ABS1C0N2_9BACT|nr:hypothetical protein [Adhaeribacter terrigena]MBK0402153.1 hypothetical protein [Adhaeribacter terrigena]
MKFAILIFIHLALASLLSCNKSKLSNPIEKKEDAEFEGINITDISVTEFKNQKLTMPSNEKSNYLISFKAANLSPYPITVRTLKDSSCVDIGMEVYEKGKEPWNSFINVFQSDFYKTIYLGQNPTQLYYPVAFPLGYKTDADSILYSVKFYRQFNDTIVSDRIYINFMLKPAQNGIQVKLSKKQ